MKKYKIYEFEINLAESLLCMLAKQQLQILQKSYNTELASGFLTEIEIVFFLILLWFSITIGL